MAGPPADSAALADALVARDRRALARAITLVESTREDHRALAHALLARVAPAAVESLRLGVSGAPGVGKSTFIEAFGLHLVGQGRRLAVLTVDPSSSLSGGSVLGDKTRMQLLARHPQAYIRPSPAGSSLGGVARRTRECVLLAEAAGYDVVLVETVGVGQSEIAVASLTDLFVLLLPPAGGDELQGIKRGIVELADLVLVNKADGELEATAGRTASEYANALRLLRSRHGGIRAEVRTCSALESTGIAEAWETLGRMAATLRESGALEAERRAQARAALHEELTQSVLDALSANEKARARLAEAEAAVAGGIMTPSLAASRLLRALLGAGNP